MFLFHATFLILSIENELERNIINISNHHELLWINCEIKNFLSHQMSTILETSKIFNDASDKLYFLGTCLV